MERTDRELLEEMLTRADIPYEWWEKYNILHLEVDKKNIEGYIGFHTEIKFTDDGALKKIGIWE